MTLTHSGALQQIGILIKRYSRLDKHERKAMTEANVVHQFVDPLLAALGWSIDDPKRYKDEFAHILHHLPAGLPRRQAGPGQAQGVAGSL